MSEDLLEAARTGDREAFGHLVDPLRRELHVHCYRLLGSLDDADDALQDTLLAAWRALAEFQGRSSLRTWLHRIATNRCLNVLRTGRRRPRTQPIAPFDAPDATSTWDVPWLQPYPDALVEQIDPATRVLARESVELAFVAALQTLPARQVAALVLCDVLELSVAEAADALDVTPTSVKGLLQRARAAVPARREEAPSDAVARTARRFAEAFARDDVDSVVALLTDDAWLAMPPAPHRYDGVGAVARFLRASAAGRPGGAYTLVPVLGGAGGHPAFGCYLDEAARGLLVVLPNDDGARVAGLLRVLDDDVHRHFRLPDRLTGATAGPHRPAGQVSPRVSG